MATKIYGRSDDLIEIDGDIYDEFGCYGDDKGYLATSNGLLFLIKYDGFWRINLLAGDKTKFEKHEGTDEEDDYSDIITINEKIDWVMYGNNFAKARIKETK